MAEGNIFRRLRDLKIDWLNHLVGFLSALLGIYIAFRLENYREEQQEQAKMKVIERTIWAEVDSNMKIYQENVEKLSGWLEYHSFCETRQQEPGLYAIGKNELRTMSDKFPTRFKSIKLERVVGDTLALYSLARFVDVVPTTGISTSSWKAGETSGLLNSMNYELVHNLSRIYEWIEKDIGPTDKDFYNNMVGNGLTDMKTLVKDYTVIVRSQELKLKQIQKLFDKTEWSEDWSSTTVIN